MSAEEVARAMRNEDLCSSSVSEDTCLSTELISEEEWEHVLSTKESVVDGSRDILCSTECADTCGPLYLYVTNFSVLNGGLSKETFAEVN